MNLKRICATSVAVMFIAPGIASASPPASNPVIAFITQMINKVVGKQTTYTASLKSTRKR